MTETTRLRNLAILTAILLVIVSGAFLFRIYKDGQTIERLQQELGTERSKPPVERIVTREVVKAIPIEVVKEVEVLKEIPVEVVREVEKPVYTALKDFPDIQTAKGWIKSNMPPLVIYSGTLTALNTGSYDCEDYALELQKRAARDGWNVWPVAVTAGLVWNIPVRSQQETNPYHVGNMFRVQGTFYYVESTPPNQGNVTPLLNED